MSAWLLEPTYWNWMLLGVVLMAIEAISPGFFFLWMGVAALLVGLALSSARALGDFGVTLMVAGNIPGRTQTLPLYIYGQVESLNFARANAAALLLVGVGIGSLWLVRRMEAGSHERLA